MKFKKLLIIFSSAIIFLILAICASYLVNTIWLDSGNKKAAIEGVNEIPKLEHTVFISHAIRPQKNVGYAFNYIRKNLSDVYAEIAAGHEYYKIRNGDELRIDSIIDCSETAGNQSVKHEYHVTELKNNSRIAYCSKASKVSVKLPWKTIESKSNTYVFYDFFDIGEGLSEIKLTIGIQFSNDLEKFFSVATGGIIPWKKHCAEEMEGLKMALNK